MPFAVACLGIALFTGMDTAMKGLSLALGAYSAMLWRQLLSTSFAAPGYLLTRHAWPGRKAMGFHLRRGFIGACMAVAWFYGLARMPMAEAVALSFIAPLIALYLAHLLLGERVSRASIIASLLGLAGMAVLLGARLGASGERHLDGVAAILGSAVLYAYNLILMRQQAQVATPQEVAFFQNLISGGWLWLALPVALFFKPDLLTVPEPNHWPLLALAAALSVISLFLLSWSYGRAEAQVLVPVEYTGFVWLAMLGAIFYGETLAWTTLVGAALIVAGCLHVARSQRKAAVEPGL